MSIPRAMVDAAWRSLTAAVSRGDGVSALAAIEAARQVGLLQACGPAALLSLAGRAPGAEGAAGELSLALAGRAWAGDDILVEVLTAALTDSPTDRDRLGGDLEDLAELIRDPSGGWVDLRTGVCWPQELIDLGDVDDIPDPDADPAHWLWVSTADSRDAWSDMADFCDALDDDAAADLRNAINGRGAVSRFQKALDRHDSHRAAWRVHCSERRTGRARRWLADAGYDTTP